MAFKRHQVGRSAQRKTVWFSVPLTSTIITTEVGTVVSSLNAGALALRPFTIVRTHIQLFLASDQEAAIELQEAAFGLAVVSDQAVAVGLSALPTPATDLSSSLWLAHQVMFADAVNITDRTSPGQKYEINSKAMRKVEIGQDLVLMAESGSSSGVNILSGGRILVKTH